MNAEAITEAKVKRETATLTEEGLKRAVETASAFQKNAGTTASSACLKALAKVARSTSKEIVSRLTAICVDTLGPKLDVQVAVLVVAQGVESFYQTFRERNQHVFKNWSCGSQVLDRLDAEIQTIKNAIREGVEIAAFDARQRNVGSVATASPIPNVSFVKSAELRSIAEVRAAEAVRCYDAGDNNAAVIMAGSALEAILLDRLSQVLNLVKAAKSAPKKDLDKWNLADLIKVTVELRLLHQSTGSLADWIRNHRNLVHPGRIRRQGVSIGREEATITIGILALVCREFGH